MNLDLLHRAFSQAFPARAPMASLEYVEVLEKEETYAVVMRLVVWDLHPDTGTPTIRDIKEQEVPLELRSLDLATVARVGELARALVQVVGRILAHPNASAYMPHQLMDFSPLSLARAHTEAEFVAALSKPSRLGKLLAVVPAT